MSGEYWALRWWYKAKLGLSARNFLTHSAGGRKSHVVVALSNPTLYGAGSARGCSLVQRLTAESSLEEPHISRLTEKDILLGSTKPIVRYPREEM